MKPGSDKRLPAVDIGVLITRIGFGAHYTIIITRNPEDSIEKLFRPL